MTRFMTVNHILQTRKSILDHMGLGLEHFEIKVKGCILNETDHLLTSILIFNPPVKFLHKI